MVISLEEGRAVDVVCLDFSKAFDTASCSIMTDKLTTYGLDKWALKTG